MDNQEPPPPVGSNSDPLDCEATIERCRQLAEKTQNPMYVWMALDYCAYQANGEYSTHCDTPLTIPPWIADYLLQASRELQNLACGLDGRIDPPPVRAIRPGEALQEYFATDEWKQSAAATKIPLDRAMKLVPFALRLTRKGWSAFDALAATTSKMQEYRWYQSARAAGMPAKQALHAIAETLGLAETRHVSRRIEEGRDLTEDPEVTKPTP
ncbi:MAG: hypothetical protein EOP02_05710 [Proteobacteria bacterium]|nr:MAG: hypothetical protein EOP02_05710 [Pseudomonadota bacterium]